MTYVVYGAAGSGSVPVEAALTLIGVEHTVVEAPTWEGDAQRDKVAGVNPMRQIPALVTPEGETITESAAILLWLTERWPEAKLAPPPGDPRRAQFLRWMAFISASISSSVMAWVVECSMGRAERSMDVEMGPAAANGFAPKASEVSTKSMTASLQVFTDKLTHNSLYL